MALARILVVEDEFLLACWLEEELRGLGYDVVGPFGTLDSASQGARAAAFDAAVLDVNLGGSMVYPLADELVAHAVPVVLLSGYGMAILPERFRGLPRLPKPVDPALLDRQLRLILAPAR